MKKHIALALGALTLAFAPAVTAQTSIGNLTTGLTTFVNDATGSLPFASAAGLDWSDAYIGSIVGVPPHFGLGVTVGATTIPGKTVKPLIDALGGPAVAGDVPIPLAAVNARIGGFLLPFDVGLKVSVVPELTFNGYDLNYQNYGLDVRYALLDGEPLLPAISVGVGVDYFAAKLKATYGSALSYSDGSGNTLTASAPTATLDLSSVTFEAKAQVSKSLLILTPYIGLAALVGSSTAKAGVSSTLTASNGLANWQQFLPGATSAGFSKSNSVANFGLKLYGGTSVNLVVFKFDLQGMYSMLDGSYGGTLGARFQL